MGKDQEMAEERVSTASVAESPKNRVVVAASRDATPTLRKAQEVIYTHPKHGKITLTMRKAFNRMVQNAHRQGFDQEWYTVAISDLARNIEWGSKDMRQLNETIDKMQTTLIKWEEVNELGNPVITSVQLIGKIKLVGAYRQDGRRIQTDLMYKIDPSVKEKLFNSKSMALIDLDLQNQFKSPHAAALYEQLMYVVGETDPDPEGWYHSMRLPWKEWRDLIMSTDTSDYYDNFKYFRRDVLKKALAALESVLDSYEVLAVTHMANREVRDLEFQLRLRPQASLALENTMPVMPIFDTEELVQKLAPFGLDDDQVQMLLDSGDMELIEGTIEYVQKRLANTRLEPIDKLDKYFMNAFAGEYCRKPVKQKADRPAASRSASPLGRSAETMNNKARREEVFDARSGAPIPNDSHLKENMGLSPASSRHTSLSPASSKRPHEKSIEAPPASNAMQDGRAYFESLEPGLQVQLREQWLNHEATTLQRSTYAKSGLKAMIVRVGFYEWISRNQSAP